MSELTQATGRAPAPLPSAVAAPLPEEADPILPEDATGDAVERERAAADPEQNLLDAKQKEEWRAQRRVFREQTALACVDAVRDI